MLFRSGAITSEDFGAYYAWGETESKNRYGYSNYKWYDGNSYTKYITSSYEGEVDNKTILDLEDDIAHVKWGGSWRIPTKAEQDELISNCTWTWTTMNGVKGYLITSKILGYVDRSIFLPAAGYWSSINYLCVGDYGYYGSSSLFRLSHRCSMDICFNSSNVSTYYNERIFGRSIRPVCTSDEWYSSLSVSMVDKKTMLVDGSDVLVVVIEKNDEVLDNPPFTIKWSSDNPSVAVVDQNGTVTAKSAGTANITASIENLSVQCAITVIKEKTIKHEYVDLGLSVKWATFNVGATKPEEYGEYYAWGEKVTKTYYQWYTYKWHDGSYPDLTKYCNDSNCGKNGFTDNKTILDNKDDVAHVKWGGSWRMPTNEEQEELLYRCTWDTMTLNGVNGFLVTSKVSGYTDCSIFLPAAGCREDSDIFNDGIRGYYWSSTLDSDYPADAYAIFLSPGFESCSNHSREYGLSVRPVYP